MQLVSRSSNDFVYNQYWCYCWEYWFVWSSSTFQCRDIRHRHKLSVVQRITQYYIMWGIKWKQWNRHTRYSYVDWKNFWDHDNLQGQHSKFGICENYSWEWMSRDLFGPRFKRKNTENKMFGKYVVPPFISWKRCFTTQNMKMSRVNFLSSSFLFHFFLLQDILWWHVFFGLH